VLYVIEIIIIFGKRRELKKNLNLTNSANGVVSIQNIKKVEDKYIIKIEKATLLLNKNCS
jgi:hypothetical protein